MSTGQVSNTEDSATHPKYFSFFQNKLRIGKRSAVVTVLFCIFLWAYGRPILAVLYTRWEARKTPELWVVPTPLADLSTDPSPGKKFSYLGYEFESPWTQVTKERRGQSVAVVNFTDGQFIEIEKGDELFPAMQEEVAKLGGDVRYVFGGKPIDSDYALISRTLYSTPRDVRLSWSRQEMAGNSALLLIKGVGVARMRSGLYSFKTDSLRGFQYGNPTHDNVVDIDAFDQKGRRISLMIGTDAKPDSRKLSQSEINRILYSLRIESSSLEK